jgi:alpha-glucosidase
MNRAMTGAVAAGTLGALALAPSAWGAASIGPQQIVVKGGGAEALIDRAPFRLTVTDGAGRPVLRQVQNDRLPPLPGPAAVTPEPGGTSNFPELRTYSPFAFEVGGERNVQHPGGLWTGNMLAGGRAGIVHFAHDVTKAEPAGAGVRLEVSTSDPTRTLIVTVAPDQGAAIRVRAELSNAAGVSSMSDSFASGPDEAFHGFGGRHNALDQRGNNFYNWTEEENFDAGPGQPFIDNTPGTGNDKYLFPNGPTAAYYVQNLFVSSRPYGFLMDRTALTRFRLDSDRPDAWQVNVGGASLDYTIAAGPPEKSIGTLTAINGRHRVPPEWVHGAMLKRNVQQGVDNPESERTKITADIGKIEQLKLPLTGFAYEAWNSLGDDFVRRTNERLRRRGIHPIGYVRAYVSDDGLFDPPGTFQDAVNRGLVAKTPTGHPYVSAATAPAALLDFTNPDTVRYWEAKLRRMFDLGFDGFMQDFGEQTMVDMRFADGSTGETMHNRYPNVYHAVSRAIMDRYERDHPGRQLWMYTRSGFSGRAGSAAFESANFPGDEQTDWTRANGIPSLATDMLNRAIGGAYGFTTDIGGYIDSYTGSGALDKELFVRWTEWAALSPIFRLHNSCCTAGTRMPWSFDGQTLDVWRAMTDLHKRAARLTRSLWRSATRTGIPPTRPLWLAYPGDAQAARQDQEWLLGPDVLVAPVVEDNARARSVYFPRGCWESPETDELHRGPGSARVSAPLGRLPYFFHCGTNPFASAGRDCLARRSPIGPRNIGRVRIGYSRKRALRRIKPKPIRRTKASYRWCVKRSSGRVSAVFAGRRRRALLVTTTAPAHGNRGVRPGRRARVLRRAYPRRRSFGRGLYRVNPRSRRLVGVRRGRIRYIAVVHPSLLHQRKRLRRYLRLAGVR